VSIDRRAGVNSLSFLTAAFVPFEGCFLRVAFLFSFERKCEMRRYLILSAALLAATTWGGISFGRDKDKDSAGDQPSSASDSSNNDSQSAHNDRSDQNRNNNNNNNSDDAQHHAALGISMVEADGHVRVTAVLPGSPAAKAGLQAGDEIRAVDDQRIRTAQGLTDEIGEQQPGATVELSIRRNGERRTLNARLANSQEISGNRGRWNRQYATNDNDNHRNNSQNGWNRNRASSYDPDSQSGSQSVNQQLRQLRQQVAQLQEEVDQLRGQSAGGTRVGYRNRSNNSSRDGGQSNDRDQD
jgi:hypothetical protein